MIIQVESVQDKVYQQIKSDIRERRLEPGEKITIRGLADRYGVSTTPIREALQRLHADGLLIFKRRAIIVRSLSAEEVHKIFEIRGRLESLAIEWAIARIDGEAIARLKAIVDQMDNGTDLDTWRELNRRFHTTIYAYADSEHLLNFIENLWGAIDPYMRLYTLSVDSFGEAQWQHREILLALEERDVDRAQNEVLRHLNHTAEIVVQALMSDTGHR
ncbi:glutamyl-tRNA(Gln) amidotransferase subunit A [Sulfobacillus acidophilus TPY]|uniref:Transcriptional regulator, GntR family n=1 Tax=Sulfobacillus acidophilus (strain ATCC 700253 / DSM 10332 / NAL) TaxID=679936 RepID=G8TTL4_SULAD|nr:glutamyl-tRNA(Gln) amidotransferase subunit A [Sulfobacillus acidophilus TPY]AEW05680.1 transcriptional regulator, GntR family [Sulfobacillus acidophilus DSM 10332]